MTGGVSQEFLDNNQYSLNGILRYEKIFGKDFVSTGGLKTTREFIPKLNPKQGERVLDIGCGIGGSTFFFVENYKVDVVAADLSKNMLSLANQKLRSKPIEVQSKIQFIEADVTIYDFPEESFDIIYSRDALIHINAKSNLIKRCFKWLKPGGRLFISDYCRGSEKGSQDFEEYVASRNYFLPTPTMYKSYFEEAGFSNIKAEDQTEYFIQILKDELIPFEEQKNEFIQEFSEKDYDDIVGGWKSKIVRCGQGEHRWATFYGEKL